MSFKNRNIKHLKPGVTHIMNLSGPVRLIVHESRGILSCSLRNKLLTQGFLVIWMCSVTLMISSLKSYPSANTNKHTNLLTRPPSKPVSKLTLTPPDQHAQHTHAQTLIQCVNSHTGTASGTHVHPTGPQRPAAETKTASLHI